MPRVLLAAGLCWLACLGAGAWWPADLVAWELLAALPWGAAVWALRRPARSWEAPAILGIAAAARLVLLGAPPVLSDDLHRYLWDGRVQLAGIDPYAYAPSAPELAPLGGADSLAINYRHLPTIYPPFAEWIFAAVAAIRPTTTAFRALAAGAEMASVWLLMALLRRRGEDGRAALVVAWAPLAAVESAVGAHVDATAIALLVAALLALERSRPFVAGVLSGLSACVKPGAAVLLPLLASGRRLRIAAGLLFGFLPLLRHAGGPVMPSLGEYARRWRHNEALYAPLHAATGELVGTRTRAWPQPLARWATGRESTEVYPDEAAGGIARLAAAVLFAAVVVAAVAVRAGPHAGGLAVTAAALLLSPVVHPWYVTWLLPFLALVRFGPLLVWVALAPLGYLASAAAWPRLVEYGVPALAAVALVTVRCLRAVPRAARQR
jgi:hypothetical protein